MPLLLTTTITIGNLYLKKYNYYKQYFKFELLRIMLKIDFIIIIKKNYIYMRKLYLFSHFIKKDQNIK